MADAITRVRMSIETTGGDASAAELGKATGGVKKLVETHADLKAKFSERFQHIGVFMFGSQLTSMIGLTSHTRAVLSTLNMGVTALATSFGIASGGIGLAIMGLTALAGIVVKIVSHKKDLNEQVGQMVDKQKAAIRTTTDLMEALKLYRNEVGKLPSEMDKLMQATKDLDDVQRKNLMHTEGEQLAVAVKRQMVIKEEISSAKEIVEVYGRQLAATKEGAGATAESSEKHRVATIMVEKYGKQLKELESEQAQLNQTVPLLKENIKAQAAGFADAADKAKKLADAHKGARMAQSVKVTGLETEYLKQADAVEKAGMAIDAIAEKEQKYYRDSEAAAQKTIFDKIAMYQEDGKVRIAEIEKISSRAKSAAAKEITDTKVRSTAMAAIDKQAASAKEAVNKNAVAHIRTEWENFFGIQSTMSKNMVLVGQQTFNSLASGFGSSIAGMILDGKSFQEAFSETMKNVARVFIQAVSEMMAKWIAMQALMGAIKIAKWALAAALAAPSGGGSVAVAGASEGASSGVGMVPAMAQGGDEIVTGPKLFLAGESGPERVTVKPLHGFGASPSMVLAGASMGGGGISFGNIMVNVSGVQDPKDIAAKVGREIVKQIRGMGQLDFRRTH